MSFTPDNLLQVIRTASYLKRFHTVPSHEHQTVAHHTWNMMALIQFLWPDCRKEVLLTAMYHDVPEVATGDMPAPFKWNHPEIGAALKAAEDIMLKELGIHYELTESEQRMVAIADTLELVLYCQEQVSLGNGMYGISAVRGLGYLVNTYGKAPEFAPVEKVLEGITAVVPKPSPSEYN